MKTNQRFNSIVDTAMSNNTRMMRPVIEKEILHYEIFRVLNKHKLLSSLVFQGGTSLRLCRGSNRFSEDLDFAGGKGFSDSKGAELTQALIKDIGSRLELDVRVKAPVTKSNVDKPDHIAINKWQLSIETSPERSDIPRQKVRIEIADVPAHTKELLPIATHYKGLIGYSNILVYTETVNEILADKLLALPMASYIRYRDIWDIAWLNQRGATLDDGLMKKKLTDYHVSESDYLLALSSRMEQLNDIVHSKDFHDQMYRFIDPQTLSETVEKKGFLDYLVKTVGEELGEAGRTLDNNLPEGPLFKM